MFWLKSQRNKKGVLRMKVKIRTLFAMFMLTFLVGTTVYAEQKDLITVTKEYGQDLSVLPGDTWSDNFTITNKTDSTVKVKLDKVEGINNSELQDMMKFTVNGERFNTLSDIKTNWFELGKGESKAFNVEFYFDKDAKNEWQGKKFQARLFFACEAPEGSHITQNGDIVQTGDKSNLAIPSLVCIASLSVILLSILLKRRGAYKH